MACFCHSGGLPHYHGRYSLPGDHRIDELDMSLNRIWRRSVRPRLLGVDHSILNLDLLWHFKAAGLEDVQINGHLSLASPGDSRISDEEAAAYALTRQKKELDKLISMREKDGEELAADGFSLADFDELIALKQARYEHIKNNPARVKEVMEVFAEPLIMIKGVKPLQ